MTGDTAAVLTALPPPVAVFDDEFWPLFLLAFRAALRIVRDTTTAEDVAADVLGRVHARWSALSRADYREAWVVRVATNRAIDLVRRKPAPAPLALPDDFENEAALRVVVEHALGRLSRRQRQAVALHFLVGLPERDVAAVLGIGEGSVRKHIARGLERLRVDFKGERRD